MADRFAQYIATVQEQVRWKRARAGLRDELYTHLLDQKDACMAAGMAEEEATVESLRQMGDPVEVGTRLDRVHRPKPQWGLLGLVAVILILGALAQRIVMTQQAQIVSYLNDQNYWLRWLMMAAVGAAVMSIVYIVDYTILGRKPLALYLLGTAGLVILFPMCRIVNTKVYGMDFYLLTAPVLEALLLYAMRGRGWRGYFICLAGIVPFTLMALKIPSVSCALLVASGGLMLVLAAAWKGWLGTPRGKSAALTVGIGLGGALAALCCVLNTSYGRHRFQIAFHPELDPKGRGYWGCLVRELLDGAEWIGQGTYRGEVLENISTVLSTGSSSNFLTWTICRFGWLAGLVLIGLLALMLVWMVWKVSRQRSMLGFLTSAAATYALGFQMIVYITGNLGFGLLGEISLPLLSWGRQVQVINMALIGLGLSVFREEQLPVPEREGKRMKFSKPSWIIWQDGDLVLRFSQWRKVKG